MLGITDSPITGAEGQRGFLIAGAFSGQRAVAGIAVVGEGLERGEARLELRLVGQAAVGDHVETAAGPERPCRGSDDGLAQRRLAARPIWKGGLQTMAS